LRLLGDGEVEIRERRLERRARRGHRVCAQSKFLSLLETTKASAAVSLRTGGKRSGLEAENPHCFYRSSNFSISCRPPAGIHKTAAWIKRQDRESASVGANSVVGERVEVGKDGDLPPGHALSDVQVGRALRHPLQCSCGGVRIATGIIHNGSVIGRRISDTSKEEMNSTQESRRRHRDHEDESRWSQCCLDRAA